MVTGSPSILLTLDGDALLDQAELPSSELDASFGSAVFLSAGTTCRIQAGPYGVFLVRAYTNVYHKN